MGLKARRFTGTVKSAILKELKGGRAMSKHDLLVALRTQPKLSVSVTKVQGALTGLLDDGAIEKVGARAQARFRAV